METLTYASKPLLYCPSRDPIPYAINYPTTWYAFSNTPDFRACSNCWQNLITGSGLERHFYAVVENATTPDRFCNFNTPRVRRLVAQYQAQNRDEKVLLQLQDHIAARVNVKPCKLESLVKPEDDFDWHRLDGGLDACHACYEDFLAGSAFAGLVTSATVKQPPSGMAMCDVGNAFCRRIASTSQDYNQFLSATAHRGHLPKCEGTSAVKAASRNWLRPKAASLSNLLVCEKCFVDAAAGTQYQNMFEPFNLASVKADKLICGFGANVALKLSFGLMMEWNDTSHPFIQAAQTVLSYPPCQPSDIKSGTPWYTVNGVSSFAVCAPCMECLVRPLRLLDKHIIPGLGTPPPGTVCALNPANPRVVKYIKKLSEAAEKGQPDIFVGAVSYIATTPPCPRSDPANGFLWTGTGVFSACSDCAREVIFETPMADLMSYRDSAFAESRKCDMYSDRVRNYWVLASRAPDPRTGLEDFHAIMQHRDAIYRNVYPQIQEGLKAMAVQVEAQKRRLNQAVALQKLDSAMAVGDHLQLGFGAQSITRYGNAQMGYRFASQMGAGAAMDFQTALAQAPIDPALKAHLTTAEKVWMEVE